MPGDGVIFLKKLVSDSHDPIDYITLLGLDEISQNEFVNLSWMAYRIRGPSIICLDMQPKATSSSLLFFLFLICSFVLLVLRLSK